MASPPGTERQTGRSRPRTAKAGKKGNPDRPEGQPGRRGERSPMQAGPNATGAAAPRAGATPGGCGRWPTGRAVRWASPPGRRDREVSAVRRRRPNRKSRPSGGWPFWQALRGPGEARAVQAVRQWRSAGSACRRLAPGRGITRMAGEGAVNGPKISGSGGSGMSRFIVWRHAGTAGPAGAAGTARTALPGRASCTRRKAGHAPPGSRRDGPATRRTRDETAPEGSGGVRGDAAYGGANMRHAMRRPPGRHRRQAERHTQTAQRRGAGVRRTAPARVPQHAARRERRERGVFPMEGFVGAVGAGGRRPRCAKCGPRAKYRGYPSLVLPGGAAWTHRVCRAEHLR